MAMLDDALRMHRNGDLRRAESLYRTIVVAEPGNSAVFHLLGVLNGERGQLARAIGFVRRAIELAPDVGEFHETLGILLIKANRPRTEALPHLLQAFRADPESHRAHYHLFITLGAVCADEGEVVESIEIIPPPARPRFVSVIICSIDEAKFARAARNYEALLAGVPHEIIRIPDARSLCEGYNRGIDRSRGDVLIFSHDDIEILTPDFAGRLLGHLDAYDVIGVAGTSRLCGKHWGWSGWPHVHGKVIQRDRAAGTLEGHVFRVAGIVSGNIQGMDGLFLAANRGVVGKVRFDAETFDGFHYYDLDFTYSAWLAGFRLAVCNDIDVIHDSFGIMDEAFERYAERMQTKHGWRYPGCGGVDVQIPHVQLRDIGHVRRFCAASLRAVT